MSGQPGMFEGTRPTCMRLYAVTNVHFPLTVAYRYLRVAACLHASSACLQSLADHPHKIKDRQIYSQAEQLFLALKKREKIGNQSGIFGDLPRRRIPAMRCSLLQA